MLTTGATLNWESTNDVNSQLETLLITRNGLILPYYNSHDPVEAFQFLLQHGANPDAEYTDDNR